MAEDTEVVADSTPKLGSATQILELRTLEHLQMILDYVEQVPILRIPTVTLGGVVEEMKSEYNAKYFPKEGEEATIPGGKPKEPAEKKSPAKKGTE